MATVQTTVRLPTDLHVWIGQKAAESKVSRQSAMVAYLLEAQRRDWSVTPQARTAVIAK